MEPVPPSAQGFRDGSGACTGEPSTILKYAAKNGSAVGVFDFLADWSITTIILFSLVVTVLAIVGSYGMAFAWRRWKEQKRARTASARKSGTLAATGGSPAPPGAPVGTNFTQRAKLTKLPKLNLHRPNLKLKGPDFGKLRKK